LANTLDEPKNGGRVLVRDSGERTAALPLPRREARRFAEAAESALQATA
jgi:hypothetical protein